MIDRISRRDVVSDAVEKCMQELYTWAQPEVSWDDFIEQNKVYNKHCSEWEAYNYAYNHREQNPETWEKYQTAYKLLEWEGKTITECIGPKPFEFYYVPREKFKEIADSYVYAYQLDDKQQFLDNIETLKRYCQEPIVDKWIERNGDELGYRGYSHPDNLEKEIKNIIHSYLEDENVLEIGLEELSNKLQNKFFEFLDMAGNFYNWTRYLNAFNVNVYLGGSPNSNKEAVIENWKKYRGKDIEIDESKYNDEYEEYE